MATIDLGKIKQVFRGTYNNATAYAVDDLVVFTDSNVTSTYICTTASTGNNPSSGGTAHANWAYVAKGTVTLPSQSGNSGKFLKTDGSSLSFDTAGGGVLQTKSTTRTNQIDVSVNIDVDYGSFGDIVAVTITPTSSSNKVLIMYTISGSGDQGSHGVSTIKRAISGGATTYPALGDSASGFHRASTGTRFIGGNNYNISTQSFTFLDSPSTTSAITYTIVGATEGANTWHINSNGENHSGAGWSTRFCTTVTAMEVTP